MTVCTPQGASSSFASGSTKTKLQRDNLSIPCPPAAQQLYLRVPKEGVHQGMRCQCSPGVTPGLRNQQVGVYQAVKGSTKPQLEFKRAIPLLRRQNIPLAKPPASRLLCVYRMSRKWLAPCLPWCNPSRHSPEPSSPARGLQLSAVASPPRQNRSSSLSSVSMKHGKQAERSVMKTVA